MERVAGADAFHGIVGFKPRLENRFRDRARAFRRIVGPSRQRRVRAFQPHHSLRITARVNGRKAQACGGLASVVWVESAEGGESGCAAAHGGVN